MEIRKMCFEAFGIEQMFKRMIMDETILEIKIFRYSHFMQRTGGFYKFVHKSPSYLSKHKLIECTNLYQGRCRTWNLSNVRICVNLTVVIISKYNKIKHY